MIQREMLTRIATLNQTTEINIAREYLQHLFLGALYRQKGSERVSSQACRRESLSHFKFLPHKFANTRCVFVRLFPQLKRDA